jgi:Pyruvate/2-oxoglutarate dehydrogenase complex, dihydrolipoamide dehydrogenase (E3) component, and related enzymes
LEPHINHFGSKITVAEFSSTLLSMADQDLVNPLSKILNQKFDNIFLSTEVVNIEEKNNNVIATFKKNNEIFQDSFDIALISIGRTPNTRYLNLDSTGIKLDKRGFIPVNKKRRTIIPNIYAIGDITGDPMLAHKATHEGKIAAENISGLNVIFQPLSIPSVIYTNPEIAWVGHTEVELKNKKIDYNKATFPWSASGRAMTTGSTSGKTKILTSKDNSSILGVGICGTNAGELISEAMLAIEMGANIEDISLTIHPHPTLSETIANASEMITKTITDLYIKN